MEPQQTSSVNSPCSPPYATVCACRRVKTSVRIPTAALDDVLDELKQCRVITVGSEVIVGGAAPRDVVVAMAVTPGRRRWCRGGVVGQAGWRPKIYRSRS
jgi:flavorubredoxin